eukprot:462346_1
MTQRTLEDTLEEIRVQDSWRKYNTRNPSVLSQNPTLATSTSAGLCKSIGLQNLYAFCKSKFDDSVLTSIPTPYLSSPNSVEIKVGHLSDYGLFENAKNAIGKTMIFKLTNSNGIIKKSMDFFKYANVNKLTQKRQSPSELCVTIGSVYTTEHTQDIKIAITKQIAIVFSIKCSEDCKKWISNADQKNKQYIIGSCGIAKIRNKMRAAFVFRSNTTQRSYLGEMLKNSTVKIVIDKFAEFSNDDIFEISFKDDSEQKYEYNMKKELTNIENDSIALLNGNINDIPQIPPMFMQPIPPIPI